MQGRGAGPVARRVQADDENGKGCWEHPARGHVSGHGTSSPRQLRVA